MILGWAKLALIVFLGSTLAYWLVRIYSRSVRREDLEREWDEGNHEQDRASFVDEGLRSYEHSLRRRLILLVYVVPALVVAGLIYLLNFG